VKFEHDRTRGQNEDFSSVKKIDLDSSSPRSWK